MLLGRTVRGTYSTRRDGGGWVDITCEGKVMAVTSNTDGALILWVYDDGHLRKVFAQGAVVLPHDYQGALR